MLLCIFCGGGGNKMRKKITIYLSAIIVVVLITSVGFAADTNDLTKYQVITPEEALSATMKKAVLISGKAPEGADILIDVYGAIDLTGQKYSLTKLPDKDSYTLISSKTIKPGALGFGEEIELVLGINRIIITFDVKNAITTEKIFYRYEVSQAVGSLTDSSITNTTK